MLFCIFDNEKTKPRTLEDTFNSSGFKALFGLGEKEKYAEAPSRRDSPKLTLIISKKSTSRCTEDFRNFTKSRDRKYNLIRVDSTHCRRYLLKLKEGIDQKSGKKLLKFSFLFDGVLPSGAERFYRTEIFCRRQCTAGSHPKSR